MEDLRPAPGVTIPASEISWSFVASGGPGGQHANRSSTKVEARLDLVTARGIPPAVRERLRLALGDEIRVAVDQERSQHRNRGIARDRIEQRLARELRPRRPRRPTRPSRAAKKRRLDAKRRRGEVKRMRGAPRAED